MASSLSIDEIKHANQEGFLLAGRGLVQTIMLSGLPSDEQIQLLLGQAKIAKEKKKQRNWLTIVANEAHSLQFHDPAWIDENITAVQRHQKAESAMPAEPPRDIRLKDNPNLQVVTADEGRHGEPSDISELTSQIDTILGDLSDGKESTSTATLAVPQLEGCSTSPVRRSPRNLSPMKKQTIKKPSPKRSPPQPRRRRDPSPRRSSPKPARKPESREPHHSRRDAPRRDDSNRRDDYRRGRPSSRQEASSSSQKEGYRRVERSSGYTRRDDQASSSHLSSKRTRPDRKDSLGSYERAPLKKQRLEGERSERPYRTRIDTSVCPIPGCGDKISREHAFGTHLPAVLDERRGLTPEITRSRVNLLIRCATRIVGGLDVGILASYISNLQMVTKGCLQVSKQLVPAMQDICTEMGFPVPGRFEVEPLNSPALLIHWRVFLVVMGCLDRSTQRELREQYPAISIPLERRPQAVDSHFHLDRTRWKMGNNQMSYKDILGAVEPKVGEEIWVTGGVAVFCDPPSYPSQEEVSELVNHGVGVAIGLHPRRAVSYTEADWTKFRTCLGFQGVCALGEVGLDQFKTDPASWDQQHVVLHRALQELVPEKVLVLHNRGDNSEMLQLLYHLKGVVPADQRIHLHCFSGTAETRDRWIQAFPNIYFGFTALVARFNANQKEALKGLDPNRLLLETDAPYFAPEGKPNSTPALLGTTAQLVSEVRGEPWAEVLRVSAANARRLYQLPGQ